MLAGYSHQCFLFLLVALGVTTTAWCFGPIQKISFPSHYYPTHAGSSGASSLTMGMKINIRIVGRKSGSEKWLEQACSMYQTRLRPSKLEVETTWHKDNDGLIKGVEADQSKGHEVVLLDPLGKTRTSEQFCSDMYQLLDQGGSRLSFVIGGAEGLPNELKKTDAPGSAKKANLLSLSSMTFTHQFARMLLIEQIYRASEIRKGSGYHK